MQFLTDAILAVATSPWIYLIVLGMVLVDGFFPPIPGETVLVAVAAIAMSSGSPNLWLLLLAGALGAAAGDNIAFALGRRVGTERFAWMRGARVAAALDFARRGLARRGTLLVLGGRYIPVGRLAINMTAGATGFPARRFAGLSLVAGALWSAHAVLIGVLAGHLTAGNPLFGAAIGIALALILGVIIDLIGRGRRALRRRRVERAGTAPTRAPGDAATAREIRDREIAALGAELRVENTADTGELEPLRR
ncbi:DedA family protein [Mycetocola spongiae]|uniref:DedA family protein n=1 Tax=Mycetocola spongiae TaxID=2859226 RepID=UPI001CF2E75D|nr:VTT domain-containing protein [Mycetocola spongiae]UCR88469.1 VTT domain-containing protein [Mycetocola spongiae]